MSAVPSLPMTPLKGPNCQVAFYFILIDIRLIVKAVSTQLYIGQNINNNSRLHINDDESK